MFFHFNIDIAILCVYLSFLIAIPLLSKRFTKNTSDFIVANKNQYFWIGFATVFMSNFSSWAFSGGAAKAYESGFAVLAVFTGNALGYIIAALFISTKMRQTNLETSHQIINARYGNKSQQSLLWVGIPINLTGHSIRVYGISLFLSAIYHVPIIYPILACVLMVLFVVIAGGAWTIATTNLMQFFFLVPTTAILGFTAIHRSHGLSSMIAAIPQDRLFGHLEVHHAYLFIAWIIAVMVNQCYSSQSMNISGRYLASTDSRTARKVAWTCAALFCIMPFLWYSPIWSMWSLTDKTNLLVQYPFLEHAANNAAYVYSVGLLNIQGMFGIIGAIMFATTVSALAGAMNNMSGNILRTFYQHFFAPNATDKHLLLALRTIVCLWCTIIFLISLTLSHVTSVSLFNAVIFMGSLLRFPIVVPLALGLLVKRTPDWSGWVTPLFGFCISILAYFMVYSSFFPFFFPHWNISTINKNDLLVVVSVLMHSTLTTGFFFSTKLWYKAPALARYRKQRNLFQSIHIVISPVQVSVVDAKRRVLMSCILYSLSAFMCGLFFITQELIYCYIMICIVFPASFLLYSGKRVLSQNKKRL